MFQLGVMPREGLEMEPRIEQITVIDEEIIRATKPPTGEPTVQSPIG
jgi:hypothetical protein